MYYASDVHGSDRLWRKFVNSARFYDVDVLVMGGDIAGKAVVPIVQHNGGFYARQVMGDRLLDTEELPQVERRIRDMGLYPYRTTEEEIDALHGDQTAIDRLFVQVMCDGLRQWLTLAEERLADTNIRVYVMIGNDDEPKLRDVLAESRIVVDPEDQAIDLGEGFQMISCSYANPTPWDSPREMPEEQLEQHLERQVALLDDPKRSIFNFHVPPHGTSIDRAPLLDSTLKPVVKGGTIVVDSVGSTAIRRVIERYQPPLALHGHIHESRGIIKVGKTVCINPGSEYADGVLHGALVEYDRKKGIKRYQLVSG